MYEPILIK